MTRLRRHLTYANVISSLCLFLLLGGGAAWAVDGPLAGQNTVGSADIINNEVQSADIRDANLTTADIRANAVTSGKIVDPTRSVNLPLGSFLDFNLDVSSGAAIDFDSANSPPSPDFKLVNEALTIEYDDQGPNDDNVDLRFIGSAFAVPQDFASDPALVLQISDSGENAGDEPFIGCHGRIHGASPDGEARLIRTDANPTAFRLDPFPPTIAAGDAVSVHCQLGSDVDNLYIRSVEFRYTATQ